MERNTAVHRGLHYLLVIFCIAGSTEGFTDYINKNKNVPKNCSKWWIGLVIGSLILVGILILLAYLYLRLKRRRKAATELAGRNVMQVAIIPVPENIVTDTPSSPPVQLPTYEEIESQAKHSPPAYSA